LPTALACVLFGFFDALQIRLQTVGGLSPDLISTLPYVAVVLVLTLTAIREQRRNARRLV
jgi:simple sugar transport system permease protein